jgi:uncharacterized protein
VTPGASLAEHNVKCIVSMDGPEEIRDELRKNHGARGLWRMVDRGVRRLKTPAPKCHCLWCLASTTYDRAEQIIEWFLDEYQPTGLGVIFMKPPIPE